MHAYIHIQVASGHRDVTHIAIAPEDAADDLGVKISHKLKPLKVCYECMYVYLYV